MIGWVLGAIGVAGAAAPYVARRRLHMPDPATAPGEFAELSQGVTHFRWFGPARGPVIVAIHGLTMPLAMWDDVAAGLGQIGYRVLAYDLYGRGYSDAPGGRQDAAFHLRQLSDLIAHQALGDDLTLMGYSMGGSIATAFATAEPDRMKRLILVASAGMGLNEDRLSRFCREAPFVGDWLHEVTTPRRIAASAVALGRDQPDLHHIVSLQLAETGRPGFCPAVLSSRRGILRDLQETEHRRIAAAGIPVIAVWGGADAVIPASAIGRLAAWNRGAAQETIAGAGHGLPYTHGADLAAILRDVMRELPDPATLNAVPPLPAPNARPRRSP